MTEFYVYAHYDHKGECFYIGKGKKDRYLQDAGRNVYWKRIVQKSHSKIILFDQLTEQEAFAAEIELIAKYSPRANFTKGGSGGCTVPTEEAKRKMASKVSKKRKEFWATKTYEEKKKILSNSHAAVASWFKKWTPEELSVIQKKRQSMRVPHKVRCLSNNTTYSSAKEACKALNLRFSSKMYAACAGVRPSFRGYRFEYVRNGEDQQSAAISQAYNEGS